MDTGKEQQQQQQQQQLKRVSWQQVNEEANVLQWRIILSK